MANLYRAIITGCEVHNMAACAVDKVHAAKLIEARLLDYGFKHGEFTVQSIKSDGPCNWPLENTIIYN